MTSTGDMRSVYTLEGPGKEEGGKGSDRERPTAARHARTAVPRQILQANRSITSILP